MSDIAKNVAVQLYVLPQLTIFIPIHIFFEWSSIVILDLTMYANEVLQFCVGTSASVMVKTRTSSVMFGVYTM